MEVTAINKQKFLAELGKLLTFMYEEDRQTALNMYSRMFDDAEDEQAVIQALGTPTRQAVTIARSYDAKMRKLQVQSQSREDADAGAGREAIPDFVLTINQIYERAVPVKEEAPSVMADQLTMFGEEYEPAPAAEVLANPAEVEAAEEVPVVSAMAEAEAEADELMTRVDSFLEDYSLEGDELAAVDAAPEDLAEEVEVEDDEPVYDDEPEDSFNRYFEEDEEELTRRKARVPLLILYILLAIPVTLLGIALLLIPTALSLALAASILSGGIATLMAAFGGFPVLADFLVVLGSAIMLLAIGLLCLWLFIWFIGGAIVGLIRGVFALGRRWCYEEVPV